MGNKGTIRKIVKKCKEKDKSIEEETSKLVKAGLSVELTKRFLKEILEEENC